jgi:hypothetical protein
LLEGVASWGSGACEATTCGSRTGVGVDELPSATLPVSFTTAALGTELDDFSCSPENNKIQTDHLHLYKY